jgi:hypothetical protein
MRHDKQPKAGRDTEDQETLFICGMIRIIDQPCPLIDEYGLGVHETHSMLAKIGCRLRWIPFEAQLAHRAILHTMYVRRKPSLCGAERAAANRQRFSTTAHQRQQNAVGGRSRCEAWPLMAEFASFADAVLGN